MSTVVRTTVVVAGALAFLVLGLAPPASAGAPRTAGDASYLTITPGSQRAPAGLGQTLTAVAYDSDGTSLGDVTSATTFTMVAAQGGNSSTATCQGNYCTAHDPGGYVIVGTFANADHTYAWGTAKMRVTAAIVMTMDTDLKYSNLLYNGTSLWGSATAEYSNGVERDVSRTAGWSTEDASVATVTEAGLVKAVGPGTTQLDFGANVGFSAYVQLVVDKRTVSITSVSPGGGYVNDAITVRGANLDTIQRGRIGGVHAYIPVQAASRLTIDVPSGATSGPLTLNTGHGFVSAPFTVYG